MAPSSPTHRYTVGSRFARTGLTCTPSVAERIDRLARPYLTLERSPSPPGAWQVIAESGPPPEGAVPESVTALGELPLEYAVDHTRRTLHHVAPEGEAWVVQSLLRATRAVHRSAANRQGVLFLHAGLVELNGIGVALVGGSRAGKTSFIMAAVLDGSGVMVGNDDVSLTTEQPAPDRGPEQGGAGTTVVGDGWPRSVSVRLDTLDLLFGPDRAADVLAALTHPANETLPGLRESGVEKHGTALIYPWEYADLLHTKIGRSAGVDALVHLSLADDPSEAGLSLVPPPERTGPLDEHVLALPNKHLNIFGHEPRPGSLLRTREALAALPTFRFRYEFRDVRRQVGRLADGLAERLGDVTGRAAPAGPEPRP
ncbi:hypothetical protein ACWC9R_29145 [Streptomyces sp. NPDC001219]